MAVTSLGAGGTDEADDRQVQEDPDDVGGRGSRGSSA
jgi:hypothetical protein